MREALIVSGGIVALAPSLSHAFRQRKGVDQEQLCEAMDLLSALTVEIIAAVSCFVAFKAD